MEEIMTGIRQGWQTMVAIIVWGLLVIALGTLLEFLFCRPKGPK
jgi:hypothetical protein